MVQFTSEKYCTWLEVTLCLYECQYTSFLIEELVPRSLYISHADGYGGVVKVPSSVTVFIQCNIACWHLYSSKLKLNEKHRLVALLQTLPCHCSISRKFSWLLHLSKKVYLLVHCYCLWWPSVVHCKALMAVILQLWVKTNVGVSFLNCAGSFNITFTLGG